MENNKNNALELLRLKAEDLLYANKKSIGNMPAMEVKRVMHELQLYHIELEMQNDELQLASVELEQQKIKFENLFELAPIGYIVTNKSGIIQNANQAALQLLGFEKETVQHKPFLLHIFKEDLDVFYVYFRKLLLYDKTRNCQIRIINYSKQILVVQVEGIVLQTISGDSFCYLTITDCTEKQQSELRLNEAKTRLEIALNASLTGIWEIDILTGQVFLDDFCCSLCGLELGPFDEKYDTLLNQVHPNDRRNLELDIRQTIIGEKPLFNRFRVVLSNQKIKYVQASAQVIKDETDRKRFIGTFTDISDKMILELETIRIKQDHQQMILSAGLQAEENEKKRISEVLHDGIAQTLYAIKLNLDQVKKEVRQPAFEQMTKLLNDSIKEIRNIAFELTPSILMDFGLAATLDDMAGRLSNGQLTISSKVTDISQNQSLQLQLNIFRIVQELVNNAIKHASASKICIKVSRKNKLISVVVTDNGTGFKKQDEASAPKGIGLSSIKNRLRLYKGTLKIEPAEKGGTLVAIWLKT